MTVKASVIILDSRNRILLQLRDENPEKGTWVLFGGSVEEGETEEAAARREIFEELHYKIKNLKFFKRYKYGSTSQPIYIIKEPVALKDLELHEGSDLKFFSKNEISSLSIGFNYKKIILDFFKI